MTDEELEGYCKQALDGLPDNLHVIDRDYRILLTNDAFRDWMTTLGLESDVIGTDLFDLFHFLPASVRNEYEAVFETGEMLTTEEMTRLRDEMIATETRKIPLFEDGKATRIATVIRDISDRKQQEQKLADSEKMFRALAEHSLVGMAIVTGDQLVYLNAQLAGILGYSIEELRHMTIEELLGCIHEADRHLVVESLAKRQRGELTTPADYEVRIVRPTGEMRLLRVLSQSTTFAGEPAVMASYTDITRQVEVERELQNAQRLESLRVLAGGIAHDFNNLLGSLFGFIDLTRRFCKIDTRAASYLDSALGAKRQATELTHQLLTFAKGGEPQPVLLSLRSSIQDASSLATSGTNVSCQYELADDLWDVEADPGQIDQVISNITINAAQAMPQGGPIRFVAANREVVGDELPPLEPGRYVFLEVIDSGPGIAEQHLPHVFDPFFTTKRNGSGLGLAISYSIVQRHGGHIAVASELGKGTTISIYLPAATEEHQREEPSPAPSVRGAGKILVMDDDKGVRAVMADMLSSIGYVAEVAESGEAAIAAFKRAQQAGAPFDAVILDLTNSVGMGGQQTLAELAKLDPKVKAIVASGYADDPLLAEFADHGFCGAINKPFLCEDLAEVLRRALEDPAR